MTSSSARSRSGSGTPPSQSRRAPLSTRYGARERGRGEGVKSSMPKLKPSSISLEDPRAFRAGFAHIRKNDPALRPVLDSRGIIGFKLTGDLFESLVESILSQQVSFS